MALAKGVRLQKITGAKSGGTSQYAFCQWDNNPYYFATCVNEAGNAVFYQSRDYGETWYLVQSLPNGVSTAVRKHWGGAELSTGQAAMVDLDVGYVVQTNSYPIQPSGSLTPVASGTPVPVPEISLTFTLGTVNSVTAMCFGRWGHLSADGNPMHAGGIAGGPIGGSLGLLYLWGDQRTTLNFVNTNVDYFFAPTYWATYGNWYAGAVHIPWFLSTPNYGQSDNFPLSRGKTGQMTGWVNGGAGTTGAAPYGYWFDGGANSMKTIYQSGEDQQPRLWRSIADTDVEFAGGGGCATGPFPNTSQDGQRSCVYGWVAGFEAVAGVDPGGTFYVSLRNTDGQWNRKVVCSIGGVTVDYVWMPYSTGHLVLGFVGNVPGSGYGLYILIDEDPTHTTRRVMSTNGLLGPPVNDVPVSGAVADRRMDHW